MKVKTKNNHFLFSMMVAALSLMSFATAHAAPGVHCKFKCNDAPGMTCPTEYIHLVNQDVCVKEQPTTVDACIQDADAVCGTHGHILGFGPHADVAEQHYTVDSVELPNGTVLRGTQAMDYLEQNYPFANQGGQ